MGARALPPDVPRTRRLRPGVFADAIKAGYAGVPNGSISLQPGRKAGRPVAQAAGVRGELRVSLVARLGDRPGDRAGLILMGGLRLIGFGAEWCPICKGLERSGILEKFASEVWRPLKPVKIERHTLEDRKQRIIDRHGDLLFK